MVKYINIQGEVSCNTCDHKAIKILVSCMNWKFVVVIAIVDYNGGGCDGGLLWLL